MAKNIVIQIKGVKKSFEMGKIVVDVLKNINFEIYSSEFVILFGPSGAGKTTIIDLVAGLDKPDEGEIFVRDEDITQLDEDSLAHYRNKRIGLVFQEFNLIPNMTALENVVLPLVFDNFSRRLREEKAKKILTDLGLNERFNHRPFELSGGEQQRVAVARAMINNPWILLVDEPTGDLDSKNAEDIMNLLSKLNKVSKRTILMVTHNLDYLQYADRVLMLKDGNIVNEIKNKKT